MHSGFLKITPNTVKETINTSLTEEELNDKKEEETRRKGSTLLINFPIAFWFYKQISQTL